MLSFCLQINIKVFYRMVISLVFVFLSGFSFTDTDDSQESRGRDRTIFYSTLPLPLAHELWVYLARQAQSTKNNQFTTSLQYLKENMKEEVDFLAADKC